MTCKQARRQNDGSDGAQRCHQAEPESATSISDSALNCNYTSRKLTCPSYRSRLVSSTATILALWPSNSLRRLRIDTPTAAKQQKVSKTQDGNSLPGPQTNQTESKVFSELLARNTALRADLCLADQRAPLRSDRRISAPSSPTPSHSPLRSKHRGTELQNLS